MLKKILNVFNRKNINQVEEVNVTDNTSINNVSNEANSEETMNVQSFDNKTLTSCPKCGANVIEGTRQGVSIWGCINSMGGDCDFVMKNVNENGEKLDISIIEEYKAFSRYKEIKAIVESCQIHKNTNNIDKSSNEEVSTPNIAKVNTQESNTTENNTQESNTTESNTQATETRNTEVDKAQTTKTNTEQKETKSYNKKSYNNNSYKNGGKKLSAKCSCGSDIYMYKDDNLVKCSNESCGFEISTLCHGRNFTEYQMAQFIKRRVSYILTFKSDSSGKEFKARTYIDFDNNLKLIPRYKFIFNSKFDTLSKNHRENLFSPDKDGRTDIPLQELIDDCNNYYKNKNNNYKKEENSNNQQSNTKSNNHNNTNQNKDSKSDSNVQKHSVEEIQKINDDAEPF